MARRKKNRVSLKPIVVQIAKAQKAARRLRPSLVVADRKRLNAKIKKLDKLRRSTKLICRALNLV
jgi:hypothetical protein